MNAMFKTLAEMTRKAFLTGILMFFSKGSLFQLVVAMMSCLAFLCAAAWLQPFASRTANLFKVGAEAALLATLMLIVLLKIDLSQEDVPGGEDFIGVLLLLVNTVLPAASLAIGILSFGLDTKQLSGDIMAGRKQRTVADEVEFDENPAARE